MAIVNVYVDGFNLYYGCLKRTPYKWLDLGALCQHMLPGDTIQKICYYTARVGARPHNPSAPLDQQIYLRALNTIPHLQITYGHFLTHSVPMALSGVTPIRRVMVDKTEEKGSDVNLGSHLVCDAFLSDFEVAVVISNDSDLAEPVKIVRARGLPVGIINPHRQHSAILKQHATFLKRLRQADLIACQFPPTVKDARGVFAKPSSW